MPITKGSDMPTIYDTITDQIVAALERGAGNWTRPWTVRAGDTSPMPHNVESGNCYRGINTLILWCAAEEHGYPTHQWGTYRQWQERGGQVRKGEKSSSIIFWKSTEYTKQNDDGQDETHKGMIARGYAVFNAAQVDGYTAPVRPVAPEVARIAQADAFFAATDAVIRHGGIRAFYSPSSDHVQMPEYASFRSPTLYYSVLAHEATHWTGSKARCDRTFGARFGDDAYAVEELVAELGAAFLCCGPWELDSEPREDHAQYLASWLRVLKRDSKAIFTAASKAQKAADYLISLQSTEPLAMAA
jgi:antirestriction protein ArdC